jgi:hypothetical protein
MKKNKRPLSAPPRHAPIQRPPLLNKRSLQWIAGGIFTLVAGYIVLAFADAKAQNWAGTFSPFLILGGYALIGIGLLLAPRASN